MRALRAADHIGGRRRDRVSAYFDELAEPGMIEAGRHIIAVARKPSLDR